MSVYDRLPLELLVEISEHLRSSHDPVSIWQICQADPRVYRWFAGRAYENSIVPLNDRHFPEEARQLFDSLLNNFECGKQSAVKPYILFSDTSNAITALENQCLGVPLAELHEAVNLLFDHTASPTLRYNGRRNYATQRLEILWARKLSEQVTEPQFTERERLRFRRALWRVVICDQLLRRADKEQTAESFLESLSPWESDKLLSAYEIVRYAEPSKGDAHKYRIRYCDDNEALNVLLHPWDRSRPHKYCLQGTSNGIRYQPDVNEDEDINYHDRHGTATSNFHQGMLRWPSAGWCCVFAKYARPNAWVEGSVRATCSILRLGVLFWDRARLYSYGLLHAYCGNDWDDVDRTYTLEDECEVYLGHNHTRLLLPGNIIELWRKAPNEDLEDELYCWREEIWKGLLIGRWAYVANR